MTTKQPTIAQSLFNQATAGKLDPKMLMSHAAEEAIDTTQGADEDTTIYMFEDNSKLIFTSEAIFVTNK